MYRENIGGMRVEGTLGGVTGGAAMKGNEKKKFTGILLTPEILSIKSINMLEKVLVSDVLYFPNSFRFSDEKLAKKYGAGRRTITRAIQRLRSEKIGLLLKVGEDKYHRVLTVNKDKLALLIEKTKDKEAITKDNQALQSKDKEADIDKHTRETLDKQEKGRFTPPTTGEVKQYASSIGYNELNAEKFVSHYEASGWMRGKTKMKDWRAAVRYWRSMENEKNERTEGNRQHNREYVGSPDAIAI
jgi:biotin operon repressor